MVVFTRLSERYLYTAEPTDAEGRPVSADGVASPEWTALPEGVVLLQSPWGGNPLVAHVEPIADGDATITFACVGAGPLIAADPIQVALVAGPAVSITLSARPSE